jgi:phosphoserine phosphatase
MHQIREGKTPKFDQYPDPWAQYETLHHASTAAANSWIAQMNAGVSETNLRAQAEECFQKKFKQNVFPAMQKLVTKLVEFGFEIWVCSASIRWAVEPGLKHLGLPLNRLVATEVLVDSKGTLTDQVIQPVPYATGKKLALEKKLSAAPLLVAGNSMGDVDMLAMATELALCITSKAATEEVRASEAKLGLEAKKRGWPIQKF